MNKTRIKRMCLDLSCSEIELCRAIIKFMDTAPSYRPAGKKMWMAIRRFIREASQEKKESLIAEVRNERERSKRQIYGTIE